MNKNFENGEADVIVSSLTNELKIVEQELTKMANRRQLLKATIEKVKGERPSDYKETATVRQMFSKKFEDNESQASKINFILAEKNAPLTSAEVTDIYIKHLPESGKSKTKREKLLKNISTILSIGNETKYKRVKAEGSKKFAYKLIQSEATA